MSTRTPFTTPMRVVGAKSLEVDALQELLERVGVVDERSLEEREKYTSFRTFVGDAWAVVEPHQPFVPGIHIDAMCEHCEAITYGKIRDLLVTLPPRFTKSLVISVMWPAWEWTIKPWLKYLWSSYGEWLAVDFAVKSRRLIQSPWYQTLWGDKFRMTTDQNVKCLAFDTPIVRGDGSLVDIAELRPGDDVLGVTSAGSLENDVVRAVVPTGRSRVRTVTLQDGTVVRATPLHRFYGWNSWRYAKDLRVGDTLSVVRRLPQQTASLDPDDVFLLAKPGGPPVSVRHALQLFFADSGSG